MNFPVVIKPFNEGSSVEVYICNKNDFFKNLKKLSSYKEIMIEKFIPIEASSIALNYISKKFNSF